MNFKKDKAFTATVSVFALALLAGVGFCVKELVRNSSARAAIEKNDKAVKKLSDRKSDFALTEANVEAEKANAKALAAAVDAKIAAIRGKKGEKLAEKFADDANTFVSNLRQKTDERAKKLADEKIAVADGAKYFGFSRYLQSTQAPALALDALPVLGAEQQVLQLLSGRLCEARAKSEAALREANLLPAGKRVFLLVKDVRREAAELPVKDGALSAPLLRDEIFVSVPAETAASGICRVNGAGTRGGTPFPSLRRPDAVNALAFQLCFVAPTSVLRNFLSSFTADGDYPVYVRDVVVSPSVPAEVEAARLQLDPPPPEAVSGGADAAAPAADDFSIFGGEAEPAADGAAAAAVPALPAKFVVQPEAPSEFLVTFEYIRPVDKKPASAEAAEEE